MPVIRSLTVRITSVADDYTRGIQQASNETRRFATTAAATAQAQASLGSGFLTLTNRLDTSSAASKRLAAGLTSVASSALHTVPGVAQLGSVLGQFAIGAGPMVAILAGVAALSLAWRHVTEDARKAKEEHQKLSESAKRAAESIRLGSTGLIEQQIFARGADEAAAQLRARDAQARLDNLSRRGGAMSSGALIEARAAAAAALKKAQDEEAEAARDILFLNQELTRVLKDGVTRGTEDAARAAEKLRTEWERVADAVERIPLDRMLQGTGSSLVSSDYGAAWQRNINTGLASGGRPPPVGFPRLACGLSNRWAEPSWVGWVAREEAHQVAASTGAVCYSRLERA